MEEQELINFIEWAKHNGFIHYYESMKVEMIQEYLKETKN